MTVNLTVQQILAGIGVLVVLAWVWRAGASGQGCRCGGAVRGTVAVANRSSAAHRWRDRGCSVAGDHPSSVNGWAMLAALGLPALLSSSTLTRALTVTTVDLPRKRGERR